MLASIEIAVICLSTFKEDKLPFQFLPAIKKQILTRGFINSISLPDGK
jgi:hypothetical protein